MIKSVVALHNLIDNKLDMNEKEKQDELEKEAEKKAESENNEKGDASKNTDDNQKSSSKNSEKSSDNAKQKRMLFNQEFEEMSFKLQTQLVRLADRLSVQQTQ